MQKLKVKLKLLDKERVSNNHLVKLNFQLIKLIKNAELQKVNKRLQQTIADYQAQIEEEQRQRNEVRELVGASERSTNSLLAEIDQNRTLLEQADKNRKALENDLHEAADRISELSASNSNLASQKRKLETDLAALRADLDEAFVELRNSEDRVKKASGDAARLTEELRAEQVFKKY